MYAKSTTFNRSSEWRPNGYFKLLVNFNREYLSPYSVRLVNSSSFYLTSDDSLVNFTLPGTLTVENGSKFSGEGATSLRVSRLESGGTL